MTRKSARRVSQTEKDETHSGNAIPYATIVTRPDWKWPEFKVTTGFCKHIDQLHAFVMSKFLEVMCLAEYERPKSVPSYSKFVDIYHKRYHSFMGNDPFAFHYCVGGEWRKYPIDDDFIARTYARAEEERLE